jgi:hypothetical protein
MSIEFVGSLVNASANNSFARSGGSDADYPSRMARLHEESGFEFYRVREALSAVRPEGDAADYARIITLVRDQEPALAGIG